MFVKAYTRYSANEHEHIKKSIQERKAVNWDYNTYDNNEAHFIKYRQGALYSVVSNLRLHITAVQPFLLQ